MQRTSLFFLTALALLTGLGSGCATAPRSDSARQTLSDNAQTTVRRFQREKPDLADQMQTAAGYAVFPSIGKGGAAVGGAYGRGMLYEHGQPTGFCDVTQASFGFQLGGQSYAELILFQDDAALSRFKSNTAELAANASAVAVTAGAHGNAQFNNGMAVYTLTNGGLMYEASVGGQRFTYAPGETRYSEQGTPAGSTERPAPQPESTPAR